MKKKIIGQLLRINKIAFTLYQSGVKNSTVVIYGRGAPVPPDNGLLPESQIISPFAVDFLVPEYIGYARSGGVLTPRNCIETFLTMHSELKKGCYANNYYFNKQVFLKYKRIIHVGRSFGGTYVPLLPRFNPEITEIALIFPAINNPTSGSVKGEESNDDFMNAMEKDGYKYLYRGITENVWKGHLNGKDDLLPEDNIPFLKNTKIFIGHGKRDQLIHFSKSQLFYQKLLQKFPAHQALLRLYNNSGHDNLTAKKSLQDILKWFEVEKLTD